MLDIEHFREVAGYGWSASIIVGGRFVLDAAPAVAALGVQGAVWEITQIPAADIRRRSPPRAPRTVGITTGSCPAESHTG
ncbi:hypothetical protein [Nocardia carnea]|uniref:hypothetical protein n=1 Tax=Nocardia carnea TaxID=37328 RepID=UPI002453B8C2|nr:hypothetical protein [Nocardia carnea]